MRKLKVFATVLAILLLGGALTYFNFIHKTVEADVKVGEKVPNFIVRPYKHNGEKFAFSEDVVTLEDVSGKICVLNMWEVNCEGCIKELPHFEQIQKEYADTVKIIAVAGADESYTNAQRVKWLNEKGWNRDFHVEEDFTSFTLTLGYMSSADCLKFGYARALPHTLIIDQTGKLVYSKTTTMTYETLKAEIDKLL